MPLKHTCQYSYGRYLDVKNRVTYLLFGRISCSGGNNLCGNVVVAIRIPELVCETKLIGHIFQALDCNTVDC